MFGFLWFGCFVGVVWCCFMFFVSVLFVFCVGFFGFLWVKSYLNLSCKDVVRLQLFADTKLRRIELVEEKRCRLRNRIERNYRPLTNPKHPHLAWICLRSLEKKKKPLRKAKNNKSP